MPAGRYDKKVINLKEGERMADNKQRGFAAMDDTKQKAIASKGGKATGGKNLTTEARAKGGKNSRSGGRNS
jgi:general stress protein YciG